MAKIAFFADAHLGNHAGWGGQMQAGLNDRARTVQGALARARTVAAEEGCEALVSLGDLFDTAAPSPQMVAAAQQAFLPWSRTWQAPQVFALLGNHEMHSAAAGDHALAPLKPVAVPIERPTTLRVGDADLLLVPFQPGKSDTWFEPALMEAAKLCRPRSAGAPRVLGLHLGIRNADTPPWLRDAADAIDVEVLRRACVAHGIAAAFAGNWHSHKLWTMTDCRIVQVGALVPTGHDNPGVFGYGNVAIWDTRGQLKLVQIPGPRFVSTIAEVEEAARHGFKPYLRAEELDQESADLMAAEALKAGAAGAIVTPWKAGAAAAARDAAKAVRGAETWEDAVREYTARAPMPDEVDRDAVAARALEYLKGSAA